MCEAASCISCRSRFSNVQPFHNNPFLRFLLRRRPTKNMRAKGELTLHPPALRPASRQTRQRAPEPRGGIAHCIRPGGGQPTGPRPGRGRITRSLPFDRSCSLSLAPSLSRTLVRTDTRHIQPKEQPRLKDKHITTLSREKKGRPRNAKSTKRCGDSLW